MANFRHGDVYILEQKKIPPEAIVVSDGSHGGDLLLALGESTGHAHRIVAPGKRVSMWNVGGQRYMQVHESVDLTHEEHAPITIPPGSYQVIIQRVYQPGGEIRQVVD